MTVYLKIPKLQRKAYNYFTRGCRSGGGGCLFSIASIQFHDLPLGFISGQSCSAKQKPCSGASNTICMHFSSVGHTESCKTEKRSLVFSGKGRLSHFLFYLSLLLLIKIFLVFWFEAKNIATWSHWWQIALPVFSSGHEGPAIQMSELQELPSHRRGRFTVWDGRPQAALTPSPLCIFFCGVPQRRKNKTDGQQIWN